MIVGIDDDTPESLRKTIDFITSTRIIAPKFYIMTPIVGTDLYHEFKKENRIVEKDIFSFSPSKAVINHPNMTTSELDDIYWEMYNKIYSVKNILRTIFHRRFLEIH